MSESDAEQRVSRVLKNKWRLDSLIGIGGMAAVYEATHRNGMKAAVKVLRRELSWEPELRARFLREGYVANTVDHPGAVRVFDDDVDDDGSVFLVMELLLGESLEASRVRRGGRLSPAEAVRIAVAMLDVLSAAHDKGIVHRDIKPENVFLTRDGQVKLLDFGIARVRVAQQSNKTQTGILLGTPAFMAPEQARGQWEDVDGRTDIWAVGATLFTMLTGEPVHGGRSTTEALVKALTEPAPPLLSRVASLPPTLGEVVDRALRFERNERWANARDMQQALAALTDLPADEPTVRTAPPDEALIAALTPGSPGTPPPPVGPAPSVHPAQTTGSKPRFELAAQTGPLPAPRETRDLAATERPSQPGVATVVTGPGSSPPAHRTAPGTGGHGVGLEDTLPLSAVKGPIVDTQLGLGTAPGREPRLSESLDVPARPGWYRFALPGLAAAVVLLGVAAWRLSRSPEPGPAPPPGRLPPTASPGPSPPATPATTAPASTVAPVVPTTGAPPGPTAIPTSAGAGPSGAPRADAGAEAARGPKAAPASGSTGSTSGAHRAPGAHGGKPVTTGTTTPARPRSEDVSAKAPPPPRDAPPRRPPRTDPGDIDLYDSRR